MLFMILLFLVLFDIGGELWYIEEDLLVCIYDYKEKKNIVSCFCF